MIKYVQLDPNGLCNAGCWFCPVAYEANPEIGKKTMPIETIRSIVAQIKDGIGEFVSPEFNFIYTAHYNEVLLYKHFEEMLQVFREYSVGTMVLTNGISLTPEKTDILTKYKDVVLGLHFNVPSANAESWSKMTNKNPKIHEKVMSNIRYAINTYPVNRISLQINGVKESSLQHTVLMENAPNLNLNETEGDTATAFKEMKTLFPEIPITINSSLVDRAGFLDVRRVMKNKIRTEGKVIGCNNMGSRPDTWIHINANGDVFICCNDYSFETVFGNINEKSIKEIWSSQSRKDMIIHSYNTLCKTCVHAEWEN